MPAEVKKKKARSTRKPRTRKQKAAPPEPVAVTEPDDPKVAGSRQEAAARAAAIERLGEVLENMPLNYVVGLCNRADLRASGAAVTESEQRGGVSVKVRWRAADSAEEIARYRGQELGKADFAEDFLGGLIGADAFNCDLSVRTTGPGDGFTFLQRLCVTGPFGTIERFAKHIEAAARAFTGNGNAGAFALECGERDPRPIAEYRDKYSDLIGGADIAFVKLFTRCDGFEDCEQSFESHTLTGPRGMIESLSARLVDFVRNFASEGAAHATPDVNVPREESPSVHAAELERATVALRACGANFVRTIADAAAVHVDSQRGQITATAG